VELNIYFKLLPQYFLGDRFIYPFVWHIEDFSIAKRNSKQMALFKEK